MSWQGAEAIVSVVDFEGKKSIKKERITKKYRNIDLDKSINKKRLKQEVSNLKRCSENDCDVPEVYNVDQSKWYEIYKICCIIMEYIEKIYDFNQLITLEHNSACNIHILIGTAIGRIHYSGVIHGDLSLANMIFTKNNEEIKLFVIDFGLSFVSNSVEHRAVDLCCFEKSLIACFSSIIQDIDSLMKNILNNYFAVFNDETLAIKINKRFLEVKSRGRKKIAFG